jgi:hypothetical protein
MLGAQVAVTIPDAPLSDALAEQLFSDATEGERTVPNLVIGIRSPARRS